MLVLVVAGKLLMTRKTGQAPAAYGTPGQFHAECWGRCQQARWYQSVCQLHITVLQEPLNRGIFMCQKRKCEKLAVNVFHKCLLSG